MLIIIRLPQNHEHKIQLHSGCCAEKKIAFAALHHRDYRCYFIVNLFSAMGDNIEHVISYWLLYQKFHSPVLAGFAVISHWTPFLFFAVYFGALADRHDCRRVIQASQLMYAAVSLTQCSVGYYWKAEGG